LASEEIEEELIKAIDNEQIVSFSYKWRSRVVEPYLIGIHEDEQEKMLRAYQVEGESESGGIPDWRLFRLGKISNLQLKDKSFTPRYEEYEPADPEMETIIHRL